MRLSLSVVCDFEQLRLACYSRPMFPSPTAPLALPRSGTRSTRITFRFLIRPAIPSWKTDREDGDSQQKQTQTELQPWHAEAESHKASIPARQIAGLR